MKRLALLLILFSSPIVVYSQSLTTENIKDQIPAIFKFNHIDTLSPQSPLAEFINHNKLYVNHIVKNYSTVNYAQIKSLSNDKNLDSLFSSALRKDSIFNAHFLESAYFYLKSTGVKILDYPNLEKITISKDQILNIASKFFYADEIRGPQVSWKVCVGFNGSESSKNTVARENLIEAFCFMAVFKNLFNPDYTFEKSFSEKMGNINTQVQKEILANKKVDIDTIRNDMYGYMAKDKSLELAILNEYNNKKEMLNFVISN